MVKIDICIYQSSGFIELHLQFLWLLEPQTKLVQLYICCRISFACFGHWTQDRLKTKKYLKILPQKLKKTSYMFPFQLENCNLSKKFCKNDLQNAFPVSYRSAAWLSLNSDQLFFFDYWLNLVKCRWNKQQLLVNNPPQACMMMTLDEDIMGAR